MPVFDIDVDVQAADNLKIYSTTFKNGSEGIRFTDLITPNYSISVRTPAVLMMPRSMSAIQNTTNSRVTLSPGSFYFDKVHQSATVHLPLMYHHAILATACASDESMPASTYHPTLLAQTPIINKSPSLSYESSSHGLLNPKLGM